MSAAVNNQSKRTWYATIVMNTQDLQPAFEEVREGTFLKK